MRPQISKPHGAEVGRYEDSVACKFSFCHSGPKMYAKVAPNIIDCRLLAVRLFSSNPSSSYLSQDDCKQRRS